MTYAEKYAKVQNNLMKKIMNHTIIMRDVQLAVKKVREIQTNEMYENLHRDTDSENIPF